jgi:glycosyltransferase involved in cell wall biosynthesis
MRICFITPYSPKIVGGVGTFLIEICKDLKRRGIESNVLTKKVKNPLEVDIDVTDIKTGEHRLVSGLVFILKLFHKIVKKRKKIDILHIQTPHHLTAPCVIMGKMVGIPTVTTFHGKLPISDNFKGLFLQNAALRIVMRFSNYLTFVSADSKAYYESPRGEVILNGVNHNSFLRIEEERRNIRKKHDLEDDFVILFLGRWVAHKGVYTLIEVIGEISDQSRANVKLLLIGSGEEEEVKKRIADGNLEDRVLPIGKVKSVREYYNASDVFVLFTSPQEGLPIAILESMACELPVIASDVSGIPEVITHEENGLLIKLDDRQDLIEKILWSIDNKDRLALIGENARRSIISSYTIENMTDKYVEVYDSSINK